MPLMDDLLHFIVVCVMVHRLCTDNNSSKSWVLIRYQAISHDFCEVEKNLHMKQELFK